MNTIDTQKIADLVNRMHLPRGIGTAENACSIAAINLALTGELTDEVPGCMSEVIGRWIIVTQDAMPDDMRNSAEWKRLLPLAAGTGRDYEKERLDAVLNHMWTVSLPIVQPIADANGFGDAWRTMLEKKTEAAAEAAEAAAKWAAGAAAAAEAAKWAAAEAAEAAAKWAAKWAAAAAEAAAEAKWAATAEAAAWETINPCQLLADLIAAGSTNNGGSEHGG